MSNTEARFSTFSANQALKVPDDETPIHILGLGNIGKLFAHSLAISPKGPPVIFLTHRHGVGDDFRRSGGSIYISRSGITTATPANSVNVQHLEADQDAPISNLIIATKAAVTAPALLPLMPRLGPKSTILFTQNGMGVVDEVNSLCFPDSSSRPNYLSAIVVHGVFGTGQFSATHAGLADMKIGHTLNGDETRYGPSNCDFPPEANALLEKIADAESLVATVVEPKELIAVQLEKLIANACINPLTAVFRCLNGGLLDPAVTPLRKALCNEASAVFLKYLDSTTGLDAELTARFSLERLEEIVLGMTTKTRENKSSMYQDIDAGRETEIDYINQWFVKQGKAAGLNTATHQRIVELVKAKAIIEMNSVGDIFSSAAR